MDSFPLELAKYIAGIDFYSYFAEFVSYFIVIDESRNYRKESLEE